MAIERAAFTRAGVMAPEFTAAGNGGAASTRSDCRCAPCVLPASLLLILLARAGFAAAQAAPVPAPDRPLPEMREFLEHVRENLRGDDTLIADYTFTEKNTEMRLDSKGGVKKTKTATYEVYPSEGPGKMYRRMVARDGKPLDEKELAAQDKEQEARAERRRLRLQNETQADRDKRPAKAEAEKKKEREIVDELLRMDDLVLEGREAIDGRSTIRISFNPRPGYKPVSEDAQALQKLAGRAWMDEENYQLVKLEATLSRQPGSRAGPPHPAPEGRAGLRRAPPGQQRDLAARASPVHGRRQGLLLRGRPHRRAERVQRLQEVLGLDLRIRLRPKNE